jgi:hypothetical protein
MINGVVLGELTGTIEEMLFEERTESKGDETKAKKIHGIRNGALCDENCLAGLSEEDRANSEQLGIAQ